MATWHQLIFILVLIPGSMLTPDVKTLLYNLKNPPTQINRVIKIVPDRKFMDYDQHNPVEVMKVRNSLPKKLDKVDINDYLRSENSRVQRNMNERKNKATQSRKMTEYVMATILQFIFEAQLKKEIARALHRDERYDPKIVERRRGHRPPSAKKTIEYMESIPDVEAMLPQDYLKKHPEEFHRFHPDTGNNVRKIKNPGKDIRDPGVQYAEMESMNVWSGRKSAVDDVVEAYLRKQKRSLSDARRAPRSKLPVLTKDQLNHVGNSLFYINDKRILGSHIFPPKEDEHSVYGNPNSLGLKVYPDSREIKIKQLKKLIKETPLDAHSMPERLFDPKHPGLSLVFDNKMMLDSAKFSKPKKHLVYGNLENLGVRLSNRNGDEDHRFTNSDFRKHNSRKSFFQRLNKGQFKKRQERENFDTSELVRLENVLQNLGKPKPVKIVVITNDRHKKSKLKKFNTHKQNRPLKSPRVEKGRGRTSKTVLKSMYKFGRNKKDEESDEKKNVSRLVYGNNDNLGIRYGNTPYRLKYTDFRKDSNKNVRLFNSKKWNRHRKNREGDDAYNIQNIINTLQAIKDSNKKQRFKKYGRLSDSVAILPADLKAKNIKYRLLKRYPDDKISEDENDANELLDLYEEDLDFIRRSSGRDKYMSREKRDRNSSRACDEDESSSTASSSKSGEKNPGNPYTIFNSKYKQNWLWNHFMDGDHMNINPYGPKFDSLGPTGNELFFGRKWWYFNQDDYKPFRRR